MTLNGVVVVTLRYFSEFTFAISSPDEFLVYNSKSHRSRSNDIAFYLNFLDFFKFQ